MSVSGQKSTGKKYKIAWLPGDGIGIEVLEAAQDRPGQAAARRRVHPRRHRLGVLVQGGRCLPAAHHRPAQERRRRHVRRHHLQAGQGGRGRAGARAEGQGAGLPLAHRAHAPAVRPLHLPAALQGLPGQPAQLQGATSTWSSSARTPRTSTPASSSTPCPQELARHPGEDLQAVRRRSRTCRWTNTP